MKAAKVWVTIAILSAAAAVALAAYEKHAQVQKKDTSVCTDCCDDAPKTAAVK